tara:strand:+ start:766 stop:1020 length:255 start_codon:yes stop_codon:yes gene_type:complete
MRDRLLKAVTEYLKGGIAKHKANIEVYLNQTVGIGEHSDIVDTIEKELELLSSYEDKLEVLNKHFQLTNQLGTKELLNERTKSK